MSITLVNILERGNKGDLTYIKSLKHFYSDEMLKFYHDELDKKLRETSNTRWDVALTIANFVRSGAWVAYHAQTMQLQDLWRVANPDRNCSENPYHSPGGNDYWCSSISFLTFMRINFGLCRTSIYNYLNVVDTFATYIEEPFKEPEYRINAEAKFYQFWQLIEMTSLTYQERKVIEPNWTREQIRAYKKELREKNKTKTVQPAEPVESEEKPRSEAQVRFSKYSKDDLISYVISLENDKSELENHIEKLHDNISRLQKEAVHPNPFASRQRTEVKREIQGCIESLLGSYDYEVKLNGRKQGIKVLSGVIANQILDKYLGEVKSPGKASSSKSKDVEYEQISITSKIASAQA